MSDHEKSDGLVVGIVVVLAVVLMLGMGVVGLAFFRMHHSVNAQRDAALQAERAAMMQRDLAEAARKLHEAEAAQPIQESEKTSSATESPTESEKSETPEKQP